MADLQREIDDRVTDTLIEELGQNVVSLILHLAASSGVDYVLPTDIVPPSELSERLGCLVWALNLVRCKDCGGRLATEGRYCDVCVQFAAATKVIERRTA